ncbi:hypothetical protein ACFWOS_19670 [Streptomyces rubiginosohelvolus]|uniref:hypothetical protein n=1 Tax=Streptomyces rubiginosohelvolus TaxID=67362 RepID=UPI00366741A7
MIGARSLAAVIALLEEFRALTPLITGGAAARFAAHGWTPGGRPRNGVETSWDKDGVSAWIQTFGDGEVCVSFAVWIRDVDASGYFDDLDAVYEQGERVLAGFLPEIEGSRSPVTWSRPSGRRPTRTSSSRWRSGPSTAGS